MVSKPDGLARRSDHIRRQTAGGNAAIVLVVRYVETIPADSSPAG